MRWAIEQQNDKANEILNSLRTEPRLDMMMIECDMFCITTNLFDWPLQRIIQAITTDSKSLNISNAKKKTNKYKTTQHKTKTQTSEMLDSLTKKERKKRKKSINQSYLPNTAERAWTCYLESN
jgi:dolichyl-phosphate-mannose--protein O-mannosyl transferase